MKKLFGNWDSSVRFISSVILGIITYLSWHGYKDVNIIAYSFGENFMLFVELILWTLAFYFFIELFRLWIRMDDTNSDGKFLQLKNNKKDFLILTGLFIIAFLPYFIIYFPGVCNLDTQYQLYDFFDGTSLVHDPYPREEAGLGLYFGQEITARLNAHHPIADTLLFAAFYKLGKLLGSPNLGMGIYSFFSVIICSALFSHMICFMDRLGVDYRIRRLSFFYLAFMPFIPMIILCVVKDSVFALLFIIYFTTYIAIIKNVTFKGELWLLAGVSVLLCLTKVSGIYAVVPANFGLIIYYLKSKKYTLTRKGIILQICSIVMPIVIVFILLPKVIYPAFNIYKGGRQEKFMTCFQQTALLKIRHEEVFTDEEISIINKVLDWEQLEDLYEENMVVTVKTSYNGNSTDQEFKEYLKLWARQGFEHPVVYIDALLGMFGGYLAPVEDISPYRGIPQLSFWNDLLSWKNIKATSQWRQGVEGLYKVFCNTPLVDLFFQMVLYDWWIPVFVFIEAIRRKQIDIIFCLLPLAFTAMLFPIMPRSYARYIYAQLYVAPLALGLAFIKGDTAKAKLQ